MINYASSRDAAAEVRHAVTDPTDVVEVLGLAEGKKPRHAGWIVKCPWHMEKTASCSVWCGDDGTIAVHCFGCGQSGDLFDLVAGVHQMDTKHEFKRVVAFTAELFGVSIDTAGGTAVGDHRRRVQPPARPSAAATAPTTRANLLDYPPPSDVASLWFFAASVLEDAAAASYLRGRGLDPAAIADLDLIRVLRPGAALPRWAAYKGPAEHSRPWTETGYRIVLPLFDAAGVVRNVRAWRIGDEGAAAALPGEEMPKRISSRQVKGLVLADGLARSLLEMRPLPAHLDRMGALRVVIAEGEPDFLSWAARAGAGMSGELAPAVFGIGSGSWSKEIAAKLPRHAVVVIRTHDDEAGDRYAAGVYETLRGGRVAAVLRAAAPTTASSAALPLPLPEQRRFAAMATK